MNISNSHMKETVAALKADHFTKFFKRQGNIDNGELYMSDDENPELAWNDESKLIDCNFWILHSYNGHDYEQLIIPPDTIDIVVFRWNVTMRLWDKPKDIGNTHDGYNFADLVLQSLSAEIDRVSDDRYASIALQLLREKCQEVCQKAANGQPVKPQDISELVYCAFEAGKEAEKTSENAMVGQDVAKSMKTMHENQQTKTRSSRLPWTQDAEKLIRRDRKISAREIAEALKEANVADFFEWRDIDGIDLLTDSTKQGSNNKSWEAFEVAVSRLKKRLE
jgi:hypothetical protein